MLPSLHIPLAQSSQSNRLTMKRKFGLGHLKVAPSTTVNNAENWDTLDKSNSRDDYTYTHVPLAPSLDAKTENELRKACAFILKDLKPSGHDLEDTRMKTDILLGTDGLGQDNRNLLPGDVRSSATQNKHWPLSKRDANRSKDRSGREKSLLENSLDSWGEERVDGRTSRSTNRQAQPPNQTRRRAPTAVAEEEELPCAPLEFLPKCVEPIPKPKEEEETFRNNAPHVDSSENSSLGQSVGSITQIRSTSTGITSAVITPAWPSQRTSENGIGSVVLSNPALTSTSVTNRQVKTQQPPERPKTPSMVTTSMELGSNLEAQAVPIISRRARSRGPGEPTDSQVVWKNKSLSDLRSATPKVEVPLRPLTPEPSRARSLQRTGIVPSAASISVNSLTAQSQPSQVLSQIRAPGAPPLFDTDDSSSVTDDDSSSQEDKEHYLLDTNTPSADESAASTAPQVINTEKVLKQNDMNEVESSKEADEEVTSPQPVVNPKNPLRYSEIEAPLASKEQKLSHDIRDKSEEPLATARARIDAREHSRRTSALLDLQQPILEQQGNDPMWESDAKPQPLNLKSKASSTNLGASPTEGTRPAELPVLSQTLAFDPSRNVPIHVPSPLPPLKHEHDESITVKDFWKPTPKPQISESVRSFSRPGTGGGTTQHRRQPAQESIEGLVQPLRSFSPVTSELSYSPIQAGQSWSAEYVPTRSSDRVAVAGPSSQAGYKRHASLTRGVQDVYRPPVISIQPGTAAAAPSSTHPRLSSMATSTHPRLGSMATSTHPRLSSIASSTHPRLNSMGNSSTTPRRSPRQQHQKHQHQHQYRPSTDSTSAAPPPDIDHFYNQYVQSHKNLDPAKAAPVVQPSLGNSGGAYHYNYTSSPPPKGGIKKLLHRLGGGDMPDRRRGVGGGAGGAGGGGYGGGGYGGGGYGGGGYGGGGHGGGGYGGGIGMQAAAAAAAAAGEEGEDYYDEDDDDLACEAPVVRFGRGW